MFYSLRKTRKKLFHCLSTLEKQPTEKREPQLSQARQLKVLIDRKERKEAAHLANILTEECTRKFPKPLWRRLLDPAAALLFALVAATIIRQMWFELYQIPTGSMRPTFMEQDNVSVSKTTFGLNIPLVTDHFLFEPHHVERAGTIIWSGDQIPLLNSDDIFLGILPYTKRYVKRLMGKPGDTLYYYGGQLYGYDKEDKPLEELLTSPHLSRLEYIPFLNFEGQMQRVPGKYEVLFKIMNEPLGRLRLIGQDVVGDLWNGKEWVQEHPGANSYFNRWGMNNFGMARLIDPDQTDPKETVLVLEIYHHPSLTYPKPKIDPYISLNPLKTRIPLEQRHLESLWNHLYTARFVVKDKRVSRYSVEPLTITSRTPSLLEVPEGTYEFYYGKAAQIGFTGIPKELDSSHPLYFKAPERLKLWYNLGIQFDSIYENALIPSRYVYFREGDLYALGAPLLKKEDPILRTFIAAEKKKASESRPAEPYTPFLDSGPPTHKTVQKDGFTLPPHHYLVLGDNHAMSSDSRVVGPIPETNLQGTPSIVFWPPSSRWGIPNQPSYALWVLPRLLVWGVAFLTFVGWWLWRERTYKRLEKLL